MKKSESITSLVKALLLASKEMSNPTKNAENPFFKSAYVDLAGAMKVIRGPLLDNDIILITGFSQNSLEVMLIHSSGEWIETEHPIVLGGKKDMQALGSAETYARRYSLMALFGLAPEDDDGNAASNKDVTPKPVTRPQTNGVRPVVTSAPKVPSQGKWVAPKDRDEANARIKIAMGKEKWKGNDMKGWLKHYYKADSTGLLSVEQTSEVVSIMETSPTAIHAYIDMQKTQPAKGNANGELNL